MNLESMQKDMPKLEKEVGELKKELEELETMEKGIQNCRLSYEQE